MDGRPWLDRTLQDPVGGVGRVPFDSKPRGRSEQVPARHGCATERGLPTWLTAKATHLGRTGRYTPAHRRSSAARNDAHRHADARTISVHTRVLAGISVPSDVSGSSYAGPNELTYATR